MLKSRLHENLEHQSFGTVGWGGEGSGSGGGGSSPAPGRASVAAAMKHEPCQPCLRFCVLFVPLVITLYTYLTVGLDSSHALAYEQIRMVNQRHLHLAILLNDERLDILMEHHRQLKHTSHLQGQEQVAAM